MGDVHSEPRELGQPFAAPSRADHKDLGLLTCVTDTCVVYLDADFIRLRYTDLNVLDRKVLASFPGYSSLAGDWLFIISPAFRCWYFRPTFPTVSADIMMVNWWREGSSCNGVVWCGEIDYMQEFI